MFTLNPFNTYAWHHFEYKRHTTKVEEHKKKADRHMSWILAREKMAQRYLAELEEEQAKAKNTITKIDADVHEPVPNGGARKRGTGGRFAKTAEVTS